jgi:hypothetical protein
MTANYLLVQEIPLDKILIASLALVAVVVVGLVVVSQVKRRLAADDRDKGQPGGFTLSDLRDMHKSGQMSDEEFERAKGMIIDAARRAAARDKKPDGKSKGPLE